MEKLNYFKRRHFNLVEMWECQYRKQKQNNNNMNNYTLKRYQYYKSLENVGFVNIKDSFYGGRTNNIKFYKRVKEDEEIKYLDFCSLYPSVLKKYAYPIGHPIIIDKNFDYSLKSYFGFISCRVLAPKNLYFPVLPVRVDDKLMFPLCVVCAENQSSVCECKDRSFSGNWTLIELLEAIKYGYEIKEIYQVMHFDSKSEGFFGQYINMWLKIKTEASGWPQK